MLESGLGATLTANLEPLALVQTIFGEMLASMSPLSIGVIGLLLVFSIFSWTIIFAKWSALRSSRLADRRFLRAFRKSTSLDAVMVASEQFRPAPMVAMFEFAFEELNRQVKGKGTIGNKLALERTLQLGANEEVSPAGTVEYELAGYDGYRSAVYRFVRNGGRNHPLVPKTK